MKLVFILMILLTQAALAASTCDNIKSDISDIGKRIENFTGNDKNSTETYLALAGKYDKALAEELLYSGLKEMLRKYKNSERDLGLKSSVVYDKEFERLAEEGKDVRRRLLVLKELVDFSVNVGTDKNKFFATQKEKKCGKMETKKDVCLEMYAKLRPMIDGYFAATGKILISDASLKQFNDSVADLRTKVIQEQLDKLEETEKEIKSAGAACFKSKYTTCEGVEVAVKKQQEFFAKQEGSKYVEDIKDLKERHERLISLHKVYTEDPKSNLDKSFLQFQAEMEKVFNCPARKVIDPSTSNNAELLMQSFCPGKSALKDIEIFKNCLKIIKEEDIDKKIADAKKRKMEAKDKIESYTKTDELNNLMTIQTLLYERFKSVELNCLKKDSKPVMLYVGCGSTANVNPLGNQLVFLSDTVNDVTLYLNNGLAPRDAPTAGKSADDNLQDKCNKKLIVLKSCNGQNAEQKAAQQKSEEFYAKYRLEEAIGKNGQDRYVKRTSMASMFGNAAMRSLSAPDNMPFFMNALTFNGQVDMMVQQAQWQAQYNYNMEQWNNIYMGNVYGGLNNYGNVFDPTLGNQNAANFGFNFAQI